MFESRFALEDMTMLKRFGPGAYHKHLLVPLIVIAALGIFGVILYFGISTPMPK